MRSITLVVLALLACFASGHYMTNKVKYADKDFLVKQAFVFEVLQHIHQDDIFSHKYDEGWNYKIEANYDHYNKVDMVKEFVELWESEPLLDDEMFTIMHGDHYEMAHKLVTIFMLAKDYETFKFTALWARFHVNKQLFVYSFSVACLHRKDLEGIVLPPIYEIYPHYFFTAETLQKAQSYKLHGFHNVKKVENIYQVVIPSNYTGKYGHLNDENLLAYFNEDIGLNAFYYYFNLDYPFWAKGGDDRKLDNDYRGAMYLFIHWQLLARYNLERLSHDLGFVQEFNYYENIETGYDSGLRYYNGVHFPARDNNYVMYTPQNYDYAERLNVIEHRLYDVMDTERVYMEDHKYFDIPSDDKWSVKNFDILGNLLQGNKDSLHENYYGSYDLYLRNIINDGIAYGKFENDLPGPLMHYETSLRDPVFFEMYQKLLKYYWYYAEQLDSYTKDELHFDGVKIENVEIDKLVTFYDKFDADITNAVDVEIYDESKSTDFQKFGRVAHYNGHDFVIKARQHRLNHLPFNFKLAVNSDKAQKASVKVFIGPKYDADGHKIYLKDNYQNFFELDHFVVDLVSGKNAISRSSDQFSWYVNDRTSYFELYQKLMLALNTDPQKFPLDMSEAHCGFPQRLMLPRGKKGGMPFQFYFIVFPYHAPKTAQFTGFDPTISCGVGSGARYIDSTPFGYPFDRPIEAKYFHYDNMYFYDTVIYHKTEAEVNAVH